MATTDTTRIPNPLYAAAGAGDLAIERLRQLPGKVAVLQERLQDELPGRISGLQDKITQKVAEIPSLVAELRQRVVDADAEKLRESARRNAHTALTGAQAAQEKAAVIYAKLVARGEQVVARGATAPHRETVKAEVVAGPTTVTEEVVEVTEVTTPAPKRANRARKAS
jgi:hypothetical protein